MTYVVLARKWRPNRFDDVVGQEHITRTLASAIEQGRVAHGYLFCGPRGVGKTTTARILAKALNCVEGPTPTPCNVCENCRDVDLGRSLDIIEVDGASTRGIDDVRELRENVRYAPTSGRTKVYIIDEVHMLTREAFNALLKTLEEPPPHVVFVMATTEPFKVPATILSRCQRFDFARIHPKDVVRQLQKILEAEGVAAEPDALALLARRSEGGMRDALSTLDQVLASDNRVAAGRAITVADVVGVLGLLHLEFYFQLTDALIDGDAAAALRRLDEVYHSGADLGELAEEFARHLRNVMILTVGPGMSAVLEELGPQEVAQLEVQAARLTPLAAARLLDAALRTLRDARRSEALRLNLEMALVEMAGIAQALPLAEVVRRLEEMERRLGGTEPGTTPSRPAPRAGAAPAAPVAPTKAAPAAAMPPAAAAAPEPPAETVRDAAPNRRRAPSAAGGPPAATESPTPPPATQPVEPAAAVEPLAEAPEAVWSRFLDLVKRKKPFLWGFISGATVSGVDADGRLVVRLDSDHGYYKESLDEKDNRRTLEALLTESARRPLGFRVEGPAGDAGATPEPAAGARSPFEIARTDPTITRVMELFDGEILP